jgi:hypothetical protein
MPPENRPGRYSALVTVTVYRLPQATDRLAELGIRRNASWVEVLEKLILQADPFARE